jgi:hypothetical protein
MSEPWAWQLPGPRRWTAGITAKIRQGSSVIIEVPPDRPRTEVVEAVSSATRLPTIRIDSPSLWTATGHHEVRSILGPAIDSSVVAPSVQELSAMAGGCLVELICDRDRPTPALLEVVEQVARYSDRRNGLRFVIGAPPGSHPGGPRLAVVPFRRVFERPDTAAYVHGRLRQQSELVDEWISAAITELSAFDLELADRLIDQWDGSPETIDDHLRPAGRQPDRVTPVGVLQTRSSSALEDEWVRGTGDWWDSGRFLGHLRYADDSEVTRRLWLASLRSTWPEIEATRCGLVDWVSGQQHIRRQLTGAPAGWELSDISVQLGRYFRNSKPKVVALVRDLKALRDDLAHMRPASETMRSSIRRLIPEAESELP